MAILISIFQELEFLKIFFGTMWSLGTVKFNYYRDICNNWGIWLVLKMRLLPWVNWEGDMKFFWIKSSMETNNLDSHQQWHLDFWGDENNIQSLWFVCYSIATKSTIDMYQRNSKSCYKFHWRFLYFKSEYKMICIPAMITVCLVVHVVEFSMYIISLYCRAIGKHVYKWK